MCLQKQDYEYGSGAKYAKILNMAGSQYETVALNMLEYCIP